MTKQTIARQFLELYSAHEPEKMLQLFAPNATFEYVPYGEQGKGKIHEGALGLWKGFMAAFPDFSIKISSISETQDGRVVAETVNGGTQALEIFGIANKHRAQYTPHVFFFSFNAENHIQHLKAYWDNNTIYYQLGHTETHE